MNGYRPDIDGLRAVAVMAVVLFHLDVRWFGGGFVGVDVFFVISGYLITKILVEDIRSTGRVDFRNFYIRRARRILPALAVTLAGCFVGAIALLTPTETASFGWSMLAAITSLSNVFFWSSAGVLRYCINAQATAPYVEPVG